MRNKLFGDPRADFSKNTSLLEPIDRESRKNSRSPFYDPVSQKKEFTVCALCAREGYR